MVTRTNFIVRTEFSLKLVPCLFISRETPVILNEPEIQSGAECSVDCNQSGTVAALILLLF